MARSVDTHYPDGADVASTLRRNDSSLQGARSFFASEGLVIYAEEKQGIAAEAEGLMLRPGAMRRMYNHLDVTVPSVAGMRISGLPGRQEGLTGGETTFEIFRRRAEAKMSAGTGGVTLNCLADSGDPEWELRGKLLYEHQVKLPSGRWTPETAEMHFFARPGSNEAVDIVLELNRPDDHRAASKWLDSLGLNGEDLLVSNVNLVSEPTRRHQTIRVALDGFGRGKAMHVSSPNMAQRQGSTPTTEQDAPTGRFARAARYDTPFHGLDDVIDRAEKVNDHILTGLTACCWHGGSAETALSVRMQQPVSKYLELRWNSARELGPNTERGELTERLWESMSPVDWDRSAKQRVLRSLWGCVLDALYGPRQQQSASVQSAA